MNKLILFLFLLMIVPLSASATDWTFYNPTGLGYTDGGNGQDTAMITNNNASVYQAVSTWYLSPVPGATNGADRIHNGANILFSMSDPTFPNRVFFTDEAGNLGYFDQTVVDYSLGFYTEVMGVCTNCNPIYRIGTLSTTTLTRRLTIDSSGNVYTHDGLIIYKYSYTSNYAQSTMYTLVSGVDFPSKVGGGQLSAPGIGGIQADVNGNIHVLVYNSGAQSGGTATGYLTHVIITPSGTRLSYDVVATSTYGNSAAGCGFVSSDIVLDQTNPLQNFTYSTTGTAIGTCSPGVYVSRLMHNSSTGSYDIGGALASITASSTNVLSIKYWDGNIYIASPVNNLIRSYASSFIGYEPSAGGFVSGVTGTFRWVNGYQQSVTTITPGQALAYMWTISGDQVNYTYFAGWGTNTATEPQNLHDLTDLTGLGSPAIFATSSNDLAGTSIYGYFLAKHKTTNLWYRVANPVHLTISPAAAGYDSITLDKSFYNLTGDTITATFTYSSGYPPYFYQWQICARIDCSDSNIFNTVSLIGSPATSSMSTTGMPQGNYYAVMMRHLPFLSNSIVSSQAFSIRPPVIGVSWDKTQYNLLPKSVSTTCLDSTPSTSYWSNISGYAGLQRGWFSCPTTPTQASANNSIMRGSLYARYNGTFYLNNSLGSVWNGTLNNGSGALIYVLTNSSATESWTLTGINASGETFYATTDVTSESNFGYSISVSPSVAYNQDILYLTFTKPIYVLTDYVIIKDAGGNTLTSFDRSATSGSYYIDPAKQYVYGTWTAYWHAGSVAVLTSGNAVYTFTVKNAGRPQTNASIIQDGSSQQTSSDLVSLIQSKLFWTLVFIVGIMLVVSMRERKGS